MTWKLNLNLDKISGSDYKNYGANLSNPSWVNFSTSEQHRNANRENYHGNAAKIIIKIYETNFCVIML